MFRRFVEIVQCISDKEIRIFVVYKYRLLQSSSRSLVLGFVCVYCSEQYQVVVDQDRL